MNRNSNQPQKILILIVISDGLHLDKEIREVERPPIEEKCYKSILQPGALIRIKAPQRMGKTLLQERLLDYARGLLDG